METVGIRELKAHLSRHLKRVRSGTRLVVTDRGRSVATISPVETPADVGWAHRLSGQHASRRLTSHPEWHYNVSIMKTRTMVYLEPRQHKALKARASAQGISLAELMRRLVGQHLSEHEARPKVPPAAYRRMVALGSSGRKDIAERHDAMVAQAVARDHAR